MPATRKRRWLRRSLLFVAILLVAAGGTYAYLTRPSAVRAALVSRLDAAGLAVRELGDVSFSLWDGLTVRNLAVDRGRLKSDDNPAHAGLAPLIRISEARLALSWSDLLLGHVRINSASVSGAAVRLIPERDARGAGVDFSADVARFRPELIPPLTADDVDVQVLEYAHGRLSVRRRWIVRAAGAPSAGGYQLRLDQVGGRRLDTGDAEAGPLIECMLQPTAIDASTGWFDIALITAFLPPAFESRIAELAPHGRTRLKRLRVDGGILATAELELADGRCFVPIESADQLPDDAEPFVRFDSVRGSLVLARDAAPDDTSANGRDLNVDAHFQGELRGAAVAAAIRATGVRRTPADAQSPAGETASRGLTARSFDLDLTIGELRLPTAQTAPAFITAEHLPSAVRSFFRKYKPDGHAALTLHVARAFDDAHQHHWQYDGHVEALGAAVRYIHFPYDIANARGFIRFSNDGVQLDRLTGQHGSAQITLSGDLESSESFTGFDLVVDGRNVPLEEDLFDALPERYQSLWREADPLGLADIRAHIHRPHGTPDSEHEPVVEIDARLLSASLAFESRRVHNAAGRLRIAAGTVELQDVSGRLDGGDVTINGVLAATRENGGRHRDIMIEAGDVALTSASSVPGNDAGAVGSITFEGRGDVWGRLYAQDGADRSTYVVRIRDGELRGFDGSDAWSHAQGWTTRDDHLQRVEQLRAERGASWIEISGETPLGAPDAQPMHINLRAGDARIENLLHKLVPTRWQAVRDALGLGGVGEVTLNLRAAPAAAGGTHQTADIELHAERMRPTPLPLDLRGIAATLQLRDDGFELREATATYDGTGRIRVHGHGGWDSAQRWTEVGVDAESINVTPEFVDALPGPLADLLRRMAVRGRMHTTLDRLRLDRANADHWRIDGRIRLDSAALSLGAPLEDFSGELAGSCEITGNDIRLDADFLIDRGVLMGRPITRWEGELHRDWGEPVVRLRELRGQLCEGEVVGEVTVDPSTTAYELSATLQDVNLAELLDPQAKPGAARPGRLDGHVFIRGVGNDPARRDGGGSLRISSASLLSNRVSAPVVVASRDATKPLSESIDHAELRFAWRGSTLMFERVDIHTGDMRLIGEGWWNSADDSLSLTLIAAHPEDAPRLAVITDLLELAGKELLQYQITGTTARPQVTVQPLHNLTEPLRRLLGGR